MESSKGFGASKQTEYNSTDSTDLFSAPLINRSVISGKTVIVRPTSENNDGPFVFNLKRQGFNEYVQLNSIKFTGKFKIVKKSDGSDITADDKVYGVNMFPTSMIKSVDVMVNNQRVTDNHNLNNYMGYLQNIFSYSLQSSKTHLKTQMFEMDTAEKFDDLSAGDTGNKGMKSRSTRMSSEFDFYTPLVADILQSDKLLLPTAELSITITRAPDSFALMAAADDYKVMLSDPQLHVRYVSVNPALCEEHLRLNATSPAIYPIIKTDMKSFTIPSNQSSISITDMFHDVVPNNIIVGIVDSDAYFGKISKNPYNFKTHDINEMYFRVKNIQMPTIPISPDFTNKLYQRDYYQLLANTGVSHNQDFGNMITPALYKGGCFFAAIDFSGELDNMLHQREVSSGTVDLQINFKNPTTSNLQVIVYSSTNETIQIFGDRKVLSVPQPVTM